MSAALRVPCCRSLLAPSRTTDSSAPHMRSSGPLGSHCGEVLPVGEFRLDPCQ